MNFNSASRRGLSAACISLILLVLCCCASQAAVPESGTLDGVYYEKAGSGQPLILLHGGQLDRRMWDAQFFTFSSRYLVIRYDLRGFGKSPMPQMPYSHTEDLRKLLTHFKLGRAHLAGLSLGAAIAAEFAILYPEHVNGLVLACPGLGGWQFTNTTAFTHHIMDAARDVSPERAAELWLENPYMKQAMQKAELQQQLRLLAYDNRHCWLNNPLLLRRMNPPASQRLYQIKARTLVIDAELDVSDIHNIANHLAGQIPNAQKKVIPDSGHMANMENPKVFNRLVLEFLRSLD